MSELGWKEAILQVLGNSPEAMHYNDIAEEIETQGLRQSLGATPASTVNAYISTSINSDGDNSPYIRVDKGVYWLRTKLSAKPNQGQRVGLAPGEAAGTGLINAFGMYWARSLVLWNSTPKLFGQQQAASTSVDFCNQKGVYLLHDGRAVVYVGRATDQPLGVRLRQHIFDRLSGRWDRFSWFGVHPIDGQTGLLKTEPNAHFDQQMLIVTMEALLIEGLEPPQNRRRGDDFRAVEFLQAPDPELRKNELLGLIDSMKDKLIQGPA